MAHLTVDPRNPTTPRDSYTLGPVVTSRAAALFFSAWFLEMTLSVGTTIVAFFAGWLFMSADFFYLCNRRRAGQRG